MEATNLIPLSEDLGENPPAEVVVLFQRVLAGLFGRSPRALPLTLVILGTGALALAPGCATPVDGTGDGGSGTGGSGEGGTGAGMTSTTTGTTTTTTTGTTTTTTTTTGTGECGPDQHLCGGVCTGNTPGTGCLSSASCTPCPTTANGAPTCSAQGTCDVTCNSGYNKVGMQCQCAAQCCSAADCPSGQTCNGGVCETPTVPCDEQACFLQCFAQMQVGTCVADICVCVSP